MPTILRIDFGEPEDTLEPIEWDEFFRIFDENDLAFLHQDEAGGGETSRFNKFVERDQKRRWSGLESWPSGEPRGRSGCWISKEQWHGTLFRPEQDHGSYLSDPSADLPRRVEETVDLLMPFVKPEAWETVKLQILGIIHKHIFDEK